MLGLSFSSFIVPVPKVERLSGLWDSFRLPRRRSSTSEMTDLAMLEAGEYTETRVRPELQRRTKSIA
ncbi:hypothetical protein G7Z17_g13680 [Cylindrodendrum hubeiense]|uniref:Uncharacterized protein n=1 Tax=Cylindrodendrum hubeiense TaxID=595255 RepID=A0A9P5H0J7_9HYPO|nr:hypothetical protein G7Z17_g13680 [Cylindrodendrum hubeiense]